MHLLRSLRSWFKSFFEQICFLLYKQLKCLAKTFNKKRHVIAWRFFSIGNYNAISYREKTALRAPYAQLADRKLMLRIPLVRVESCKAGFYF